MKTQLILLNEPIIVSDETPKIGDNVIGGLTGFDIKQYEEYFADDWKKIIAGLPGLPSINWNGLEKEFGYIDVEKLARDLFGDNSSTDSYKAWIEEFKAAQQIKGFSLEDMRAMYDMSCGEIGLQYLKEDDDERFNEFLQLVLKPKVFDIEIEMETVSTSIHSGFNMRIMGFDFTLQPKITNNQIKILRKV